MVVSATAFKALSGTSGGLKITSITLAEALVFQQIRKRRPSKMILDLQGDEMRHLWSYEIRISESWSIGLFEPDWQQFPKPNQAHYNEKVPNLTHGISIFNFMPHPNHRP